MKHIILIILATTNIVFSYLSFAQSSPPPEVMKIEVKAERQAIARYDLSQPDTNRITLEMAFDKSEIRNPELTRKLQLQPIKSIDLVYTLYPKNKDFTELNRNRLIALYNAAPDIFQHKDIKWKYVGQNGCETFEQANAMFHGFVVYFKPKLLPQATPKTKEKEAKKTEKKTTQKPPKKIDIDKVDFGSKEAIKELIDQDYVYEDSTVYKIFERNKDWNDMLIVTDWTGSMYQYGLQVLTWMKLNQELSKRVKKFIFFNDGDKKRDSEKIIGKTGGIYHVSADNMDLVMETMAKAQRGGTGGDIQENDLEALLFGVTYFKECKTVVLIADSQSPIRDMMLLPQVVSKMKANNQKLKIILCGAKKYIQPEYVGLAYETRGSLHTIEQDIDNLIRMSKGESIKIEDTEFSIKQGKFMQTKRK
ncbi:MAG: hypothetical protein NZ551_11685 [Microscillaceae bacterium]|nr:hypothetical protein [Microscillaceae bacterium]MDW8461855.1 hypothetical protein [Cytophagales bacterium]